MIKKPGSYAVERRKFLIDRKLQLGHVKLVLVLIAVASAVAMGFYFYTTRGTLTMNYDGAEIRVLRSFDFFLPMALLSMFIVLLLTSVIGVIVLVYYAHRVAGPLYRFRVALDALNGGDLTHRFHLRSGDQLKDLADSVNGLSVSLDERLGALQARADELGRLAEDLRRQAAAAPVPEGLDRKLNDLTNQLAELQHGAHHFKTSQRP